MPKQTLSDILWQQAINDNNFAQAEKIYQHLLTTGEADSEHHTIMGLWYQQLHNYPQAIQALNAASSLDAESSDELYYQIALCYFEQADYPNALKYLSLSLENDPDFADAIFLKAETSAILGDKVTAADLYKRLLLILPGDVQLCIAIATSLSEIGYADEAIEIYFRALLIEPENYYLYSNLGAEYTELGEYDNALFCHKRALALNSFCADLWYNIACTYAQTAQITAGLDALEKSINLDEANKEYATADDELIPLHNSGRFWKMVEQ